MRKWEAIKKRIRSKTHRAAFFMMSIGVVVEGYAPEIKQVVSDHFGMSWGILYAVIFMLVMNALREITTKPIEEK
ncbi:MAG: hypothetical protein Q7T77_04905 [Sulfuricurvum sp.]|nr:hypothetical protein [Sulfuricurvum sp.]